MNPNNLIIAHVVLHLISSNIPNECVHEKIAQDHLV